MKPKLFLVVAVIVLLAGLAGGGWYWYERQHSAVGDTLVLHGNVDIREVQLAFNASDRIERILVREGDRVTAGQLLALLDSRGCVTPSARRRRRWPRSGRSSHALSLGRRPEEIRKAQADVEAARADAVNAEQTYGRTLDLVAAALRRAAAGR